MTTGKPSSASLWLGRVLTTLVTLVMIADAVVDIFHPRLVQAEMAAIGFPEGQVHLVGAIIMVCAALYSIPRTSVLGAIIMTGFLGGAICTHLRRRDLNGTAAGVTSLGCECLGRPLPSGPAGPNLVTSCKLMRRERANASAGGMTLRKTRWRKCEANRLRNCSASGGRLEVTGALSKWRDRPHEDDAALAGHSVLIAD
jgi:hypothetical protein